MADAPPYHELFASGAAFHAQLVPIICIALSIVFWLWLHKRFKLLATLKPIAFPLILWIIFGTLDITITARGAHASPILESNPSSRYLFESLGILGPGIAAILWIALWVAFGLGLHKLSLALKQPIIDRLRLVLYYSLACGHFFGFISWFSLPPQFETFILFILGMWNNDAGWQLSNGLFAFPFLAMGIALALTHAFLSPALTATYKSVVCHNLKHAKRGNHH